MGRSHFVFSFDPRVPDLAVCWTLGPGRQLRKTDRAARGLQSQLLETSSETRACRVIRFKSVRN